MVPQDALGPRGTLRVSSAPWAEEEPQGTVPPVAGWAGSEARAAPGFLPTLLGILSLSPPPTNCSHIASGFPVFFSSSGAGLGHRSALVAAGRWRPEQGRRMPHNWLQGSPRT